MAKNYYAILDLSPSSTTEAIRTRFRELARTRHPDRFRGEEKVAAEIEFQELTEAFNVLCDPERRRLHDLELARPETTQARASDAEQVGRLYLQRGIKAYREKNYLEAADNFDRATKADPENAQAWHHLALACSHQQRWLARGLEAIVHACELEKMNDTYLKLAGKLHAQAGLAERAEHYYNEALTWGGEDAAVRQAIEELRKPSKRGWTRLFGKVTE
ncbi:MAG: J domain-containing protein [Acidobacteriota bacterium]